jgi:hypothetical protein
MTKNQANLDAQPAETPTKPEYKGRFTWTVMVAILIGASAGAVFG